MGEFDKSQYYYKVPTPLFHYDNDVLSPGCKQMYIYLLQLSRKDGYCYCSNAHLMDVLHVSEKTISRYIKILKVSGFIKVKKDPLNKNRRLIYPEPIEKIIGKDDELKDCNENIEENGIDIMPSATDNMSNAPTSNTVAVDNSSINDRQNVPIGVDKSSVRNINNNIKNNNNRTCNGNVALSKPTLDDVLNYAKRFGLNLFIDAEDFYNSNSGRNWKDQNGVEINNWKALFNNWNQKAKVEAQKVIAQENSIEEKIKLRKKFIVGFYKANDLMSCPNCGAKCNVKKQLNIETGICHCNDCNVGFSIVPKDISPNRKS